MIKQSTEYCDVRDCEYLKQLRHKAAVNLFLARVTAKPLDYMVSEDIWKGALKQIYFLIKQAHDAEFEISIEDILGTRLLR